MRYFCFLLFLIALLFTKILTSQIDVQGHRGCRGLMPENTIQGFIKAVSLGVTTLEMDVVITKDNKIVLSHEPFLSHEICLDPQGHLLDTLTEKYFNIFEMDYETIKFCDCGSKVHPRFKDRSQFKVSKPLLENVIDSVENYIKNNQLKPVNYNIEIKSTVETDNKFHPIPSVYTKLVIDLLTAKYILHKITLQSFDVRVLQFVHSNKYDVKTALLVENNKPFIENLKLLGFTPTIYSPYFKFVNEALVSACKRRKILLIPWTVNEAIDIKKMILLKVDGIISDYPDRVLKLVKH